MASIMTKGSELEDGIKQRQVEIENARSVLANIERDNLRSKLVQVRRIMSLAKENRLWREVALGVLQQSAKDQNGAKKLLNIILKKAGITPSRTWDDLEEEELLEAVEGAKSRLNTLPRS